MIVTIGKGNARRSVELPSVSSARLSKERKIEREKAVDSLKNFLFRPALLKG